MSTEEGLQVTSVDRVDGTAVLVEFSDGTTAMFTVEQLAALAPDRQGEGEAGASNGAEQL